MLPQTSAAHAHTPLSTIGNQNASLLRLHGRLRHACAPQLRALRKLAASPRRALQCCIALGLLLAAAHLFTGTSRVWLDRHAASTWHRELAHVEAGEAAQPVADHSRCVAFHQTDWCSPLGTVHAALPCDQRIEHLSGYCLCEGRVTTRQVACGAHRFTCAKACAKLASGSGGMPLPRPVECHAADAPPPPDGTSYEVVDIFALDRTVQTVWDSIDTAYEHNMLPAIEPPGVRTKDEDWVRDGLRMSAADVRAAHRQWQSFLADAPEYPAMAFSGRGVVMVGGGMRYLQPAWVGLHMLRRAGCRLPVEVFFPVTEFPTYDVERYLTSIGVTSRKLQMRDLEQGGYSIKVAAMLLSRFREVIFLDADNIPVRDPAVLLDSPQYVASGALLWQDYWESSAAPELAEVLGLRSAPHGSFESGQMAFDKQRVWRGLLLAYFMNMQSRLYYELLSNYMGKGDKETFAAAFLAVGQPFHTIATPPGSLGVMHSECDASGNTCTERFLGNTMTQHDPSGKLLFLHTNISPKLNTGVPDDFDTHYTRRWQVLATHSAPGRIDWLDESRRQFGEDLEHVVYQLLRALRCAPFFVGYERQRQRMGDVNTWKLEWFHHVVHGVDFNEAYREGLSGNFQRLVPLSSEDSLAHIDAVFIEPHRDQIHRVQSWLQPLLKGRRGRTMAVDRGGTGEAAEAWLTEQRRGGPNEQG